MNVKITGSKKKPLDIPNIMMPTHSLKNTTKTYELDGPSADIASKVENPPWNTDEPIWLIAIFAL